MRISKRLQNITVHTSDFIVPARTTLLAMLFILGTSLTVHAQESVPDTEEQDIVTITKMIENQIQDSYRNDGTAHRDAHAKAHGCVQGVLNPIEQKTIPRAGIFAKTQTYPIWIRYSNGSGKSQNDNEGDGRGMAIKVLNVPGDKILDEEKQEQTQDFLMINYPVFFVKNASDYVQFQNAITENAITHFFFPSFNPFTWRTQEMKIAQSIRTQTVANPLNTNYFSMTPYMYGKNIAKFAVSPCHNFINNDLSGSSNFLKENMQNSLNTQEACFDFKIQLQTNPNSMPVEDPRIEWSSQESPFVTVAQIKIPKQTFTSDEQMKFCENLSYTPWHSLPDHQPLGGINRVRKVVYQTISKLRHKLNDAPRIEPSK